jgi:hypothetical protein
MLEKDTERREGRAISTVVEKEARARARADQAAAKPGGSNTTIEIIEKQQVVVFRDPALFTQPQH